MGSSAATVREKLSRCCDGARTAGGKRLAPDFADLSLTGRNPYVAFTRAFNVTGQPAISLPAGRTAEGLPIGVQLAADHGREDLLLAVAAQLERARPWKDDTPTL